MTVNLDAAFERHAFVTSDFAGCEVFAHQGMIDANTLDINMNGLIAEKDAAAVLRGEMKIGDVQLASWMPK